RYLGVGAMLVGGVWALIRLAPSLARGISAGLAAHRAAAGDPSGAAMQRTERDIPVQAVLLLSLACLLPLAVIFHRFSGTIGLAALMSLFAVVAGLLSSAVAADMAGLVGSPNNPISGVTIATILVGSHLLSGLVTDAWPA